MVWFEDGGARFVILSQDELVHKLHAPMDIHSSTFQAVNTPPPSKKLSNGYPPFHHGPHLSSSVTANHCLRPSVRLPQLTRLSYNCRLQRLVKILIMWAPGHSGLSGNELADHQSKLSAAETQPNNTLESDTQRALIRRSCRPSHIQHERLKEVYVYLPDEQIKTSFAKTKRTNLARFCSSHHPALQRW